jgi:hypothetical protein
LRSFSDRRRNITRASRPSPSALCDNPDCAGGASAFTNQPMEKLPYDDVAGFCLAAPQWLTCRRDAGEFYCAEDVGVRCVRRVP